MALDHIERRRWVAEIAHINERLNEAAEARSEHMALTNVLRLDPYLGFRFVVEIEGLIVAGFTEVSGLSAEVTPFAYKEGGVNEFEHQLPGPATWPRLVLRRGLTDVDNLWRWHEDVRRGRVVRRNGSIILGGESHRRTAATDGTSPAPTRSNGSGPELRAASATVAVESVELVHRGLAKGSARMTAASSRDLRSRSTWPVGSTGWPTLFGRDLSERSLGSACAGATAYAGGRAGAAVRDDRRSCRRAGPSRCRYAPIVVTGQHEATDSGRGRTDLVGRRA